MPKFLTLSQPDAVRERGERQQRRAGREEREKEGVGMGRERERKTEREREGGEAEGVEEGRQVEREQEQKLIAGGFRRLQEMARGVRVASVPRQSMYSVWV